MAKRLVGLSVLLSLLTVPYVSAQLLADSRAQLEREYAGMVFIEVRDASPAAQRRAGDVLTKSGGRPIVAIGDYVLLGWLPPGASRSAVASQADVVTFADREAGASSLRHRDPQTVAALNYFNSAKRGERLKEIEKIASLRLPPLVNDVRTRDNAVAAAAPATELPDLSRGILAERISRSAGDTQHRHVAPASWSPTTWPDEVMDDVHFVIFCVQSNGAVDPQEFSWSWTDYQNTFNRTIDALDFWGNQSWVYGFTAWTSCEFRAPFWHSEVFEPYEPIRHRSTDEALWINPIMANLGYTQPSTFDRVSAFNLNTAIARNVRFAVSLFVAYNPSPAPGSFTDGYASYAFLGGPFTQSLFRNFGDELNFAPTIAHEYGHLFWACDEYYSPGYATCGCGTCYTNGPRMNVGNGNCEAPSCNAAATDCIMRWNTAYVFSNRLSCNTTKRQIGWIP